MVDLRYGDLRNYRDLFAKLQRDADTYASIPSADNLFNAIITAWSLTDWLYADAPLTAGMDHDLEELTGKNSAGRANGERLSTAMQICKDVTNGSKHAKITRYEPKVNRVSYSNGSFGSGVFGPGRFGGGEYFYVLIGEEFHDAEKVPAMAIEQFERFFRAHERQLHLDEQSTT